MEALRKLMSIDAAAGGWDQMEQEQGHLGGPGVETLLPDGGERGGAKGLKKTERLEVRLSPVHYEILHKEATQRGVSMGRLVREAVEEKYGNLRTQRIEAVRKLALLNAPVADWEQMKREIEQGYLSDLGIETLVSKEEGGEGKAKD